jgi:hypothetical protein
MNSKVGRLIDEYNRSGMGDQLIDAWTGEGDDQQSLRELADYFNRELLRAAMAEAGMTTLDGEVANTYRLLTAEDVSTGVRTQAETTLDRNGINPQQLQQDFVSHQAIHTYLTKHRGVEHPAKRTGPDRIETADDTIQRLGSRLVAVAEKRLGSLRDTGAITLGTFSVLVDVRVVCEDCGTHADVRTLLASGGCDCETEA